MSKPRARATRSTSIADGLPGWIEDRKPVWIDFLEKLALAESPSLEPSSHEPVMELLAGGLAEAGFDVRRVPGTRSAGQLYAVPRSRPRGRPYQLVIGHCDTVWPVGTLSEMPVAAEGNRLRGPGVFDMKGGLANIVFALRALNSLGLAPQVTPVVLVTSDEETGSVDSRKTIERLAGRADRALVLEPALGVAGKIKTARKGTGSYRIVVKGRAAHPGLAPEEGASAILEMSHIIQELFALNDPSSGITVNVGTVGGGLQSNVIAPESHAEVDVRVLTREHMHHVDNAIKGLVPVTAGVTLHISGGIDRPPMEGTPRNRGMWELCRTLGGEIGLELDEGTAGGASDGNFTSQMCATLDGLGAVGHGAHAHHEHILIDETLRRCALLALILMAPPIGP
jgi:glutamate carboxypeptidase